MSDDNIIDAFSNPDAPHVPWRRNEYHDCDEWIAIHYRSKGWNINTLEEDVRAEFGHLEKVYGYEMIFHFYTCLLWNREVTGRYGAANDSDPDRTWHALRLYENSIGIKEQSPPWKSWRYAKIRPHKFNPFFYFGLFPKIVTHVDQDYEKMSDLFKPRGTWRT